MTRETMAGGGGGWWCERCERAVRLPEDLDSPARCPHCRKRTAVWVPPGPWLPEWRCRPLYAAMHAAADSGQLQIENFQLKISN